MADAGREEVDYDHPAHDHRQPADRSGIEMLAEDDQPDQCDEHNAQPGPDRIGHANAHFDVIVGVDLARAWLARRSTVAYRLRKGVLR